MPAITLPWTMEIWGKPIAMTNKAAFVAEFDCELSIEWKAWAEDEFTWQLEAVIVEWTTPPRRNIITKESDPELWPILQRGFDAAEFRLSEPIMERIREALSDEIYAPREAAE